MSPAGPSDLSSRFLEPVKAAVFANPRTLVGLCQSIKASKGDVKAILDRLIREGLVKSYEVSGVEMFSWIGPDYAPPVKEVTAPPAAAASSVTSKGKRKYTRKALAGSAPGEIVDKKITVPANQSMCCPWLLALHTHVRKLQKDHTLIAEHGIVFVKRADLEAFFNAWDGLK